MTISCKHAGRYSDSKLQRCIDLQQVMTMSCKHAVRYSDKMLQSCIGLQAGNDNKFQTCNGVQ